MIAVPPSILPKMGDMNGVGDNLQGTTVNEIEIQNNFQQCIAKLQS